MPYNWAQLAYVEKWRRHAVRGQVVGLYRPEDKTYFDVRLRPGEGGVGQIPGPVEVHLLDSGDIVREKRVGLLDRVAVILRVVVSLSRGTTGPGPAGRGGSRRRLEPGSSVAGRVVLSEGDVAVLDVGFPVVAQFPEGAALPHQGQSVELSVAETPKGFIVV